MNWCSRKNNNLLERERDVACQKDSHTPGCICIILNILSLSLFVCLFTSGQHLLRPKACDVIGELVIECCCSGTLCSGTATNRLHIKPTIYIYIIIEFVCTTVQRSSISHLENYSLGTDLVHSVHLAAMKPQHSFVQTSILYYNNNNNNNNNKRDARL